MQSFVSLLRYVIQSFTSQSFVIKTFVIKSFETEVVVEGGQQQRPT
jgi:hypothetical protein